MTTMEFIKLRKWFAVTSWSFVGAADSFSGFMKFMVGFPAEYVRFMRASNANR